ncbi:cdc5 protein [Ceraceosorus bombacis]|uniref:Pre-mRNA-splicing factor CEF1 n=1 Tax=Ceraceosorus bombacis TaxID=401625 RepID=A0A0P1BI84_9BASI|nr:cdc5 protein [Ceraceosorus bombacis]
MVRIIIKGGVWKNTEDEILKAAISKYGKNQWARISSLLVRKTPKQCKARWYEWLDPSIKKTEWSKEEDEKLLHLAKLMPTQWRTIAPIVGRTATQCLERYQKLLDEAEQRDGEEGSSAGLGLAGPSGPEGAPTADDVRRLRPGEIDPDPETKPARPDPIDMDEDEKEMLSEARARLANTQGKKAKRKAREQALEEARRLALLQKRRELKAAGIIMRPKKPKKGMDYNEDIPYAKAPVPGFYDTSDEASRSYRAPVGQTLAQLDGKRKESAEERKRKTNEASAAGAQKGKDASAAQREEQIRKLKEAEQISKRRKLNLPDAQVGEREVEQIVKLGHAGEMTRGLVQDGNEASEGLLGEYTPLDRAKQARTARTAPEEDTVMREARNLRNMTAAQTPLLGEANAPLLEGTGAASMTPRQGVAQTPNPLLTPMHTGRDVGPGATPMSVRGANGAVGYPSATPRSEVGSTVADGRTPLRTPLRDNLGLNAEDRLSSIADTPRDAKRALAASRRELQAGLSSLPAPKNDFELVMDEEEGGGQGEEELADMVTLSEEDAAERDARLAKLREEQRIKELARRTQVVQRGLPRPANVDAQVLAKLFAALPLEDAHDAQSRARQLINAEMVRLLHHDSVEHPIRGSRTPGGAKSSLPLIEDQRLQEARSLVHSELAQNLGYPGAKPDVLKRLTASSLDASSEDGAARLEALEAALEQGRKSVAWDARAGAWVDKSLLSEQQMLAGLEARLEAARSAMSQLSTSAAKDEKRLGKILGGYQARSKALSDKIKETSNALVEASVERAAFERLQEDEGPGMAERTEKLMKEVRMLENRENEAQAKYRDMDEERRRVQAAVLSLQEELDMREAERLNEEAVDLNG